MSEASFFLRVHSGNCVLSLKLETRFSEACSDVGVGVVNKYFHAGT